MLRERMDQMGDGRNFEGAFREFLHLQGMDQTPWKGLLPSGAVCTSTTVTGDRISASTSAKLRSVSATSMRACGRSWGVLRSAGVRLRRATPYDVELPTGMRFTVRDHREHHFSGASCACQGGSGATARSTSCAGGLGIVARRPAGT